jgi:hypothetical protein
MGHYESIITYSEGMHERNSVRSLEIAPYIVSASWRLGDWIRLENALPNVLENNFEACLGKLLFFFKTQKFDQYEQFLNDLKTNLVATVSATSMDSYSQSYEYVHQLSILSDIERYRQMIYPNRSTPIVNELNLEQTLEIWNKKLDCMKPVFKIKETVLNLRRILLGYY